MAQSDRVVLDLSQLEGGDGTIRDAMVHWSVANGPVPYLKWVSLYWALVKANYAPIFDSKDRKVFAEGLKELYEEVHQTVHGQEYKTMIAEAKAQARQTTIIEGAPLEDARAGSSDAAASARYPRDSSAVVPMSQALRKTQESIPGSRVSDEDKIRLYLCGLSPLWSANRKLEALRRAQEKGRNFSDG